MKLINEAKRMQQLAGILKEGVLEENKTSVELGIDLKDINYNNYDQWKDELGDPDEAAFFKKLADRVKSGAIPSTKFDKTLADEFKSLEWKSKPDIKQVAPTKTEPATNSVPKPAASAQPSIEQSIRNLDSNDTKKVSMVTTYDWDDVDEDKLLDGLLQIIQKVNPQADLEKKKISLKRDLPTLNDKLFAATQKSFSAEQGLKDYFKDNIEMFK